MFSSLGFRVLAVLLVLVAAYAVVVTRALNTKTEEVKQLGSQLEAANKHIEQLTRIQRFEHRISRVADEVVEDIGETENAEALVPADVANAWYDGIVRLRAQAGIPTDANDVSGLVPDATVA